MPAVEVKSRRVGGANFQVPTEVRPERKIALGMKWLISYARRRGEKTNRVYRPVGPSALRSPRVPTAARNAVIPSVVCRACESWDKSGSPHAPFSITF